LGEEPIKKRTTKIERLIVKVIKAAIIGKGVLSNPILTK
jgi:hypothetical protein